MALVATAMDERWTKDHEGFSRPCPMVSVQSPKPSTTSRRWWARELGAGWDAPKNRAFSSSVWARYSGLGRVIRRHTIKQLVRSPIRRSHG